MAFEKENIDIIKLLLNRKGTNFNIQNEIYLFIFQ